MPRFQHRPVTVEAFQLPPAGDHDLAAFHAWADAVGFEDYTSERDEALVIEDEHVGGSVARPGDWIVKCPATGRFYVVEAAGFAALYEPAGDDTAEWTPPAELGGEGG